MTTMAGGAGNCPPADGPVWALTNWRPVSKGYVGRRSRRHIYDSQVEDEMARQTRKAVEQRTRPGGQAQQRLAARQEAAKKGAETRRHKREAQVAEVATQKAALKKHEAKLVAETRKMLEAEAAAEAQEQQAPGADGQTRRAAGPMVTVALRGESAQHFRALAATQGLSLSKLLVRMMEVFEVHQP